MLVLTRKVSERFMIGDDIVVTVVKIDGRQVRIGIEAPRDVVIRRTELTQFDREGHAPGVEGAVSAVRSHLNSPRLDPARDIN